MAIRGTMYVKLQTRTVLIHDITTKIYDDDDNAQSYKT